MSSPLRIYIGWDPTEPEAYDVAAFSLRRRASIPLEIVPLVQSDLRARGLYWRGEDKLASTEFTYTRFLTPHLAGYAGKALYCDCDFLWLGDVAKLIALTERAEKAVWCVQHDYRPTETQKMEGAIQTVYPRKNWSSLMLFDCAHPATRRLTPETVNSQTGAYLHRMQWAEDDEIGNLPTSWNWLEGWSEKPAAGHPDVIHFTRGGPWFDRWRGTEYADLWLEEQRALSSP